MIVIRFWHIVSNVFVHLSIIYLISVCQAAAIQTEDAYAYPEEQTDLETYSPELTEPIPKEFFQQVEKVGAFEDISNGSEAETTTKLSESVTTTSPMVLSDQNQTNSTEAATESSQLYTESTTMPIMSPTNETPTNAADLNTQTGSITEITPPITTTLCAETSTDQYNKSITEPTTPLSSSDATTMTSGLRTNATISIDLHTSESITKPVVANFGNISASTSNFLTNTTTSDSEPIATISLDFTTVNKSDSENSTVPPPGIPDPRDPPCTTNMTEEYNNPMETSTQALVFNSSSNSSDSKGRIKDTLELLYDEEAAITTKFTPRYEEGYYDPKRAPTRYAQHEEYITTTHWRFSSDYGIGIRDYNLILYAVNNSAVLEKGSLLNYVYFVFKEVLHVNMTLCDIRYCRYLRSKTHDNTKKVPPVLVAFTKMDVKNEILHKRKMLKPTGIKVEHDMPKKILEEQNALLKPLMDKYRAMGQYVVVRSGKLLVEGKVLTQINLPDKYTYDPLQTFVSYVSTTAKPTTVGMQLPREIAEYGFGGDKKSGKKKKGVKGAGGRKKRKPMIRIPLDDEIGHELSVDVLFTTRRFWL